LEPEGKRPVFKEMGQFEFALKGTALVVPYIASNEWGFSP